jgi:hypothetical protein
MMPVRENREGALETAIGATKEKLDRFLDERPRTHFARLTLIPALLDAHGEAVAPGCAYLVLAADFDGPREAWVAAVASSTVLDPILAHCKDYPLRAKPVSIAEYLMRHSIEPGFSVISYRCTVPRARGALTRSRALRTFASEHEHTDAKALRKAFRARFGCGE